jgi:type IV fimbrial biogenesis protein FimT
MIMKKITGFTLIELMAMVALIGLLMAVSVPSLKFLTESPKTVTAARELLSALHVARSEAIRWNSVACVCPRANWSSAAPLCSGDGNWETGWIAFVETGANCAFSGGDRVVKSWDGTNYAYGGTAGSGGITVRTTDSSLLTAPPYFIRFTPRGRAMLVGGGSQGGTFTICDSHDLETKTNGVDARYARGVGLHMTGRARMIKTASVLNSGACPD